MRVITLAYREQGLMTAPGNPKAIRSLADLARQDVSFINRNPGSGTRLWLDRHLQESGIPTEKVNGYANFVNTHTACGRAVQSGAADVALGLRATAHQLGLDFIPLFHERYDLIYTQEQSQLLEPLMDTIQTLPFRQGVNALHGYDTTHTGELIPL